MSFELRTDKPQEITFELKTPRRVLIVESDRAVQVALRHAIGTANPEIEFSYASSSSEARDVISTEKGDFDLILCGARLEDSGASIALWNECKKGPYTQKVPFVMVSGFKPMAPGEDKHPRELSAAGHLIFLPDASRTPELLEVIRPYIDGTRREAISGLLWIKADSADDR
jgi:hypothetical protein